MVMAAGEMRLHAEWLLGCGNCSPIPAATEGLKEDTVDFTLALAALLEHLAKAQRLLSPGDCIFSTLGGRQCHDLRGRLQGIVDELLMSAAKEKVTH